MEQWMKLIEERKTWFQFFDMIRIIEPGGTHRVLYSEGTEEFDILKPCFQFWGREEHCANCVSKRAFQEQTTMIKFEYRNEKYYLVISKPVQKEEKDYILEVVINITKQMNGSDEDIYMHEMVQDIVEKLEHVSKTDAYTKLYNKNHMMEVYKSYKKDHKSALYMALFDIDDFKIVNDVYGHALGDEVLLYISNILGERFCERGCVARFGGDEFGILFSNENRDEIIKQLNEVKTELDEHIYSAKEDKIHITVSYGMENVKDTEDFLDALHVVDKELYYAKKMKNIGRNKVDL